MTGIRKLVLVVALTGIVFAIYGLSIALNYQRYSGDVVEELTYFPSGRFLQIASLGYEMLASDLLWLKGIQYYGEHRRGDKYYPLADHIFSTITDLDPQFVGAYRFGAFVLAQDMGQPAAGIHLLKKGMISNPCKWQIPFDLGFLYFTSANDDAKAGHFFKMASRFADSPDIAKRFSAFAYRRAGRTNLALSLWEEIYNSSSNSVIKESALYSINSIRRDEIGNMLAEQVEQFRSITGRVPSGLYDLIETGLVETIPEDPFGGMYFFDRDSNEVLSTSAVLEDAARTKQYLERKIDQFHDQRGYFPGSIADLKCEGLIDDVPAVAGADIDYHASSGKVHYVFSWEEQE